MNLYTKNMDEKIPLIASRVILFTLLAATLFLPLLCKTDKENDHAVNQLNRMANNDFIFLQKNLAHKLPHLATFGYKSYNAIRKQK